MFIKVIFKSYLSMCNSKIKDRVYLESDSIKNKIMFHNQLIIKTIFERAYLTVSYL